MGMLAGASHASSRPCSHGATLVDIVVVGVEELIAGVLEMLRALRSLYAAAWDVKGWQ